MENSTQSVCLHSPTPNQCPRKSSVQGQFPGGYEERAVEKFHADEVAQAKQQGIKNLS